MMRPPNTLRLRWEPGHRSIIITITISITESISITARLVPRPAQMADESDRLLVECRPIGLPAPRVELAGPERNGPNYTNH